MKEAPTSVQRTTVDHSAPSPGCLAYGRSDRREAKFMQPADPNACLHISRIRRAVQPYDSSRGGVLDQKTAGASNPSWEDPATL